MSEALTSIQDINRVEQYLSEATVKVGIGGKLPSIRQIRTACGVGQSAIDRAIENLSNRHVLVVKPRSGIYAGVGSAPDVKIFYFRDQDSLAEMRLGHFYSVMVHGLFWKLSDGSRRLKLENYHDNQLEDSTIEELSTQRPFSIITIGINESNYKRIEKLRNLGFAILHLLPDFIGKENVILTDDKKVMQTQLEYLVSCGHRKIAYMHRLNESRWSRPENLRWVAFHQLALEMGIELRKEYIIQGDCSWTEEGKGNMEAAYKLTQLQERPTALILSSDAAARSAYKGLRQGGMEPGRDIAVLGTNNSGCCSFFDPLLSSVGFDVEETFRILNDMLLKVEKGHAVDAFYMSVKLFERESTTSFVF